MGLKPHKLLNRQCSTAIKQEECISLKQHKLLTRSCSGDPRCEHNSTLKPHKLLSRSYSSNLRMEELDGLKNHKLLSKSCSSAPKASKMDLLKEPIAEGRRLSLTSGLIGILTPAASSQPAVGILVLFIFLAICYYLECLNVLCFQPYQFIGNMASGISDFNFHTLVILKHMRVPRSLIHQVMKEG